MDGFDVLRELRRRNVEPRVIMLTARGQVVDKVVGLKLGADDHVTKPFEMTELLARIEAKRVERRRSRIRPKGISSGTSAWTSAAPGPQGETY